MDDNFAVVDVVDGDDFQHAARAVGADVQHTIDVVDVGFNWTDCHRVVDGVPEASESEIPWRRALSLIPIK